MGILDELLAEMTIYTQMRDAIRQVAPRLFRSEVHRAERYPAALSRPFGEFR